MRFILKKIVLSFGAFANTHHFPNLDEHRAQ